MGIRSCAVAKAARSAVKAAFPGHVACISASAALDADPEIGPLRKKLREAEAAAAAEMRRREASRPRPWWHESEYRSG